MQLVKKLSLIFCFILAVGAGAFLLSRYPISFAKQVGPREITERGPLLQEELNTITIFEQAAPSVVFITTKQQRRNFFSMNVMEIEAGSGSGFIWDNNGHIVTNAHVISDGNTYEVILGEETYEGTFVGWHPDKDLAVLKINAPPSVLKPIPVGTVKDLKVGQKVFAIGNPFGWDNTLTVGVISALNRTILSVAQREIENVIQTDAAINPGNSGGPLLDSAGRLIGVNTQIISTSGSSAGIGFAIPVDAVNRFVPELIQHGKVTRAGLGIRIYSNNDSIMRRLNMRGVLVRQVNPRSAAALAGLRGVQQQRGRLLALGDVINKVEDETINEILDFHRVLDRYKPGQTIRVGYLRDNRQYETEVTLESLN
jgi:S1-C subfamily serine protease